MPILPTARPDRLLAQGTSSIAAIIHGRDDRSFTAFKTLAAGAATPVLFGAVVSAMRPEEAVCHVLATALGAAGGAGIVSLHQGALAHLLAGQNIIVIGDGFETGPALKAVILVLRELRNAVREAPAAGRVVVLAGLAALPEDAATALSFDRIFRFAPPELAIVGPDGRPLPEPFAARVRWWAGISQQLAEALCAEAVAGSAAQWVVRQPEVDAAAERLIAADVSLHYARHAAASLSPAVLAHLASHDEGATITPGDGLTSAQLDMLGGAGALIWLGPETWGWASRLHWEVMCRLRDSNAEGPLVRLWTRAGETTAPQARVIRELRDGAHDQHPLIVDAAGKHVRVRGQACQSAGQGHPRVFALLEQIVRGIVEGQRELTYDEITATVFPDVHGGDRQNIFATLQRLRKALGKDLVSALLQSRPGTGYSLDPGRVDLLYVTLSGTHQSTHDG